VCAVYCHRRKIAKTYILGGTIHEKLKKTGSRATYLSWAPRSCTAAARRRRKPRRPRAPATSEAPAFTCARVGSPRTTEAPATEASRTTAQDPNHKCTASCREHGAMQGVDTTKRIPAPPSKRRSSRTTRRTASRSLYHLEQQHPFFSHLGAFSIAVQSWGYKFQSHQLQRRHQRAVAGIESHVTAGVTSTIDCDYRRRGPSCCHRGSRRRGRPRDRLRPGVPG
jgi:hypothetical protein